MRLFVATHLLQIPSTAALWREVEIAQIVATKEGRICEANIKSGKFLMLCCAALVLCDRYKIEQELIEVYEDGGTATDVRGKKTSVLIFNGGSISYARKAPSYGLDGAIQRYCTIDIPSSHPARSHLFEDDLLISKQLSSVWISDKQAEVLVRQA